MTITRNDLVKCIYKRLQEEYRKGVPRYQVREAVEIIISLIADALIEGASVKISGFGSFKVYECKAKKAKDFRTGEPLFLPPYKTITFKASYLLKRRL